MAKLSKPHPFYKGEIPMSLRAFGVGKVADNPILWGPPSKEDIEINQVYLPIEGEYRTIENIINEGYSVGISEELGIPSDEFEKVTDTVPGQLVIQPYWTIVYPPYVNSLPADITEEIVRSTESTQSLGASASETDDSSVDASVSASVDVGLSVLSASVSGSLAASVSSQLSTSNSYQSSFLESGSTTNDITLSAGTAATVWQKKLRIIIEYKTAVGLFSKDDSNQLIASYRPGPLFLPDATIVSGYIDSCPVNELPIEKA